jgi:hypothetical protein
MATPSQVTARLAKIRAEGRSPLEPAPLPERPEQAAGMADEITFLRSRGFLVTAGVGAFQGFWKVDGQHRTTEWVRDKVASVKARQIRNAPAPVQLTGDAPIEIVSAVAPRMAPPPAANPVPAPVAEAVPAPAAPAANPAAVAEAVPAPVVEAAPAGGRRGRSVDYRGLGEDGVRECLQALLPHFPSAWAMGGVLGDQKNFSLMLAGRRPISARIVEALYGPDGSTLLPRWLELIAGGPVSVPAPVSEQAVQPPFAPDPLSDAAPAAEAPAGGAVPAAAAEAPSASDVTLSEQPWSRIEDRDLLPILRGKAAGMAAEIAGLKAEYAAGERALEELSRRCKAIDRRRAALLVTIDHFEEDAARGEQEEERASGKQGEAACGRI